MSALMLRRIGAAAACATALLAGCDSPTVPLRPIAYDFIFEGFGERLIYRWPDGATIGVYVLPSADPQRTAVLEQAFDHTAAAWNGAVLYGEYELVRAPLDRADVVLAWANETLPLDTSECPPFPSGSAWTTFCTDEGLDLEAVAASRTPVAGIAGYPLLEGQHREDGVHMIVQVLDNPTTEGRVAALVAHEFGHVLGIGTHPCRLPEDVGCTRGEGAHESLMYVGLPERSTPSSADRATIEVLYHTVPHLTP